MKHLGEVTPAGAARSKAILGDMLGLSNPTLGSVLLLVFFIVCLGWFSDTSYDLLLFLGGAKKEPQFVQLLFGIAPFLICLSVLIFKWKKAQRERVMLRAGQRIMNIPHKGVIVFLSPLSDALLKRVASGEEPGAEDRSFSWRQIERGLKPHAKELRKLWVVTSEQGLAQMPVFQQWLEKSYSQVEITKVNDGNAVDLEDVAETVRVLENIYNSLPRDFDESDVVLDVTGGFKTCSVAGMIVAMSSKVRAIQYVQNHPPHDPLTYTWFIPNLGTKVRELK